jgi:hypothetical protein
MSIALISMVSCSAMSLAAAGEMPSVPAVTGDFGAILSKFGHYDVVLRPDKDETEWWAGGPSVARDAAGVYWMACRMRTPEAPRGLRGYEVRILRSEDGIAFEKALSIRREDVPIPGFERPALLFDAETKRFKLYGCGPWKDDQWSIVKFDDADSPDKFVASTAHPVIEPQERLYDRDIAPVGYKDPVILKADGKYHCYVIGYIRQNERIFHFSSEDGEKWAPVGGVYEPLMGLNGWHDFFVRPSSVLPVGVGYLFIYEGSNNKWYDPVYNIATGVGFTFDLHRISDLTPDSPLLVSPTPGEHFATFRYSSWLRVDNAILVYAEVACPNGTFEVRRYRLEL